MGIKLWAERGIRNIKDLYFEDRLMSFQELITKFDISTNHFIDICIQGVLLCHSR